MAIDIMTVTQHIVTQYGDINLNQCWPIIGKVQWQLSGGNLIGDTSATNY